MADKSGFAFRGIIPAPYRRRFFVAIAIAGMTIILFERQTLS